MDQCSVDDSDDVLHTKENQSLMDSYAGGLTPSIWQSSRYHISCADAPHRRTTVFLQRRAESHQHRNEIRDHSYPSASPNRPCKECSAVDRAQSPGGLRTSDFLLSTHLSWTGQTASDRSSKSRTSWGLLTGCHKIWTEYLDPQYRTMPIGQAVQVEHGYLDPLSQIDQRRLSRAPSQWSGLFFMQTDVFEFRG